MPYFEEKARINSTLEAQKQRVESLERDVSDAKLTYAKALRCLERISDEIHRHRSQHHSGEIVQNGIATKNSASEDSKCASVRQWLNNPQSPDSDFKPHRPQTLPQEFADKCVELMTPHANCRSPRAASPRAADADNWTEIDLEYSSPEQISFEKCSHFPGQEGGRQVPYERLQNDRSAPDSNRTTPLDVRSPLEPDPPAPPAPPVAATVAASRVSAASPRRIIKPRAMSCAGEDADLKRGAGVRERLRAELPAWVRRERSPPRRQSLDVILDTGGRVREMLQGFTLFNMPSLSERRTSAPASPPRRMPSPLDKTLSYLNVYADSDEQGSDTDSLASVEMLTDEQIHSLMLDAQLEAVCSQLLGVSVSPTATAAPVTCVTP